MHFSSNQILFLKGSLLTSQQILNKVEKPSKSYLAIINNPNHPDMIVCESTTLAH